MKTKVKTFNNMINKLFAGDEIPKEELIMSVFQQFVLIQY